MQVPAWLQAKPAHCSTSKREYEQRILHLEIHGPVEPTTPALAWQAGAGVVMLSWASLGTFPPP
jgi:hypothetical protein